MFKVALNFPTFAPFFDLTPIEEDFLLHLVWKAPALTGGGLISIEIWTIGLHPRESSIYIPL